MKTIQINRGNVIVSGMGADVEWVGRTEPEKFQAALAYARETVNAGDTTIVQMAAQRALAAEAANTSGKLMASKYAGEDAATGQEFRAGTKIYYYNHGAYVA